MGGLDYRFFQYDHVKQGTPPGRLHVQALRLPHGPRQRLLALRPHSRPARDH
ncbi:MAG: hypothetical protein WKG07_40930 [Hymenobacter sp.]